MTDRDAKKAAQDYVMKHRQSYKAPQREIKQAVSRVAKALSELKRISEPTAKAKGRVA